MAAERQFASQMPAKDDPGSKAAIRKAEMKARDSGMSAFDVNTMGSDAQMHRGT